MLIARSWPAEIPEGRSYVVDDLPRLVIKDYDYRPALRGIEDSVILVEWDIAFSPEQLSDFIAACRTDLSRVRVAPYRLYPKSTGLKSPVWAHRVVQDGLGARWAEETDEACQMCSFGFVYLPQRVIRAHLRESQGLVTDASFSAWHHTAGRGNIPIEWSVRVTHLHW